MSNFWDDIPSATGSLEVEPASLDDVYASPGHLIRRSHQISASLFSEELDGLGITAVQYAALTAIREHPGVDQRALGRLVAIDRSTIGTVLKGLDSRALITRTTPETNLRIKVMHLTEFGESLLAQSTAAVAAVQRRLLAPLSPDEQASFLHLISKLVEVNNRHSRAPLLTDSTDPTDSADPTDPAN